ncbi:MAG: O-antigen ligase family protein [Actinobacteria bacterium]|nr:O-antigen ligase family protein [Actinomycetota bacterium]
MTQEPETQDAPTRAVALRSWSDRLEVAAVVTLLLVILFVMVPRYGGRDPGALPLGLIAAGVAFVVCRPWQRLRLRTIAIAASVPLAAYGVCLMSPTGWSGAPVAAAYTLAALCFLTTAAFARSPGRRALVLALMGLAGFDQFRRSFLAWWGGENPGAKMIGTFYWHNQYGTYLAAIALVGAAVAIEGRSRLRVAGWALALVASSGVVLSASRASIALLAGGWIVLGVVAARGTPAKGTLLRCAALPLAVVGAVFLLTSAVLFPGTSGSSPVGGVTSRGVSGETAESSAHFRLEFWRAAVNVAVDRPLAGAGLGGYGTAASEYLPLGMQRSPYAHNVYLQDVAEGGLLLGLPLAASALAVAFAAVRRIAASRAAPGWQLSVAPALAALLLLLHAGLDFDWVYPALFAFVALLGGLTTSGDRDDNGDPLGARRARVVAVAVLVGLAAASTLAVRADEQLATGLAAARRPGSVGRLEALARARPAVFADSRVDAALLVAAVPKDLSTPLRLPESQVRAALHATARRAAIDANLQILRARAMLLLGERDAAIALARGVVSRYGARRVYLVGDLAEILAAAGEREQAAATVLSGLAKELQPAYPAPDQAWSNVAVLAGVVGPDDPRARCAVAIATRALGPPPLGLRLPSAALVAEPVGCSSVLRLPGSPRAQV